MIPAETRFSDNDRLDWLRLIRTENVGPTTFRDLLARHGSAASALEAIPELVRRGGGRRLPRIPDRAEAEKEWAALDRLGGRLVLLGEADYPNLLAAVDDAPPVLSAIGDLGLAAHRSVALVGARNASGNGLRLTTTLAAELGAAGILVVSGLARGIDAAAHQAALATGTAAAVAGGLDVFYPRQNEALQRRIAEHGFLISEAPLGTEPLARHFPRRNRLVSGLSLGVVVVEAALRSGSLITARQALDQGRDVFAVPGSPLDMRCRGANRLLKEGAILVESAEDILNELADRPAMVPEPRKRAEVSARAAPAATPVPAGDRAPDRVIERLGASPLAVDEIARQCQLSVSEVLAILLEAELAGRIERHAGNRVSLIFQ